MELKNSAIAIKIMMAVNAKLSRKNGGVFSTRMPLLSAMITHKHEQV
jgi:hypothetical protein